MSKRRARRPRQPRSWTAVAAKMRNSAGPMGGGSRRRKRRERHQARDQLRRGDWDAS